jgi:hypothetical protein
MGLAALSGGAGDVEGGMAKRWLQIRGAPAIRQFLLSQSRVDNGFDAQFDEVLERVTCLLVERGIFHAKVHFSSGQVTLWSLADPYNYQVYLKEEFLGGGFLKEFRYTPYPLNASVPPDRVREVFSIIRSLRHREDAVSLRSGSLNIINGVVGLMFSCDGAHYIDYLDFLHRQHGSYG